MKTTSHHRSTTGLLIFIALVFSATASAFATATAAVPSKRACTDSRTVVVVTQRSSLPNGKGTPNVVKQTKRVCTACAAPTAAAEPMLPNGRGARVASSAPAEHECGDCR